jgi:hypothetical protein
MSDPSLIYRIGRAHIEEFRRVKADERRTNRQSYAPARQPRRWTLLPWRLPRRNGSPPTHTPVAEPRSDPASASVPGGLTR